MTLLISPAAVITRLLTLSQEKEKLHVYMGEGKCEIE